MKIQTRKIVEKKEKAFDPITKKPYEYTIQYENGFVEEKEVDLFNEVNAFSLDKGLRLIGVNKDMYKLTLKSWKVIKKELIKSGLMSRFDLSKSI